MRLQTTQHGKSLYRHHKEPITARTWTQSRSGRRRRSQKVSTAKRLIGDTSRMVHVYVEDEFRQPVVLDHDPGCSLQEYISLPVSQFVLINLPLGGQLQRIGPNLFRISVSKLELAGVWVRPLVECSVQNEAGFVDIVSTDLDIETSSHMDFLRLKECVDFRVSCQLKPQHDYGQAQLVCSSQIRADVAPPSFFSYIPTPILESTAHMALKTSLSTLQSTFVRSLAHDYERWATSSGYREVRRQHAEDSEQQLTTGFGS